MRNKILLASAALALGVAALVVWRSPSWSPLGALPTPGGSYDRVVCNSMSSEWTMHVLLNGVNGADGLDAGDVDEDGDLDLIVPFEQDQSFRLLFNPGTAGAFSGAWTAITMATGMGAAEGACFGDFDDDGHLDVVGVAQGGIVEMSLNPLPSDPTNIANWSNSNITTAQGLNKGWMTCDAADVDGDGDDDLVIGGLSAAATGELSWFAQGAAWARNVIESTGRVMSFAMVDLDGDTDLDVIASDREAGGTATGIFYMLASSAGTSWARTNIITGGSPSRMMFTLGDIDDDGDVLDFCSGTDDVTWNGRCFTMVDTTRRAWNQTVIRPPATVGTFQHAIIGDIDLDTYPDIVVSFSAATSTNRGVIWLKGPTWVAQPIDADGVKFDNSLLIDLDGDGDLDVVNTEQDAGGSGTGLGVVAFENPCI